MGAKASSNPCPIGFESTEECGWFSCSDNGCKVKSSASVSSRAVPVGATRTAVGGCSPNKNSKDYPAAPSCESGWKSIYTIESSCSDNFSGTNIVGWREIRGCKNIAGRTIFTMFGKEPSDCANMANGGLSDNWALGKWCDGSSNRNRAGYCWLPYHLDENNFCFPQNKDQVGQFQLNGYARKGGEEIMISSSSNNGLSTPIPQFGGAGGGINAGIIGGGAFGAAAVIGGIAIGRKRMAAKKSEAPSIENELPAFKTVV